MSHQAFLNRLPAKLTIPPKPPQDERATEEERAILAKLGDKGACVALQLPRSTLARIAAGWSVRHGTMHVFRWRLSEWREKQATTEDGK